MKNTVPRWKLRLRKELSYKSEFSKLDEEDWRKLLKKRSVTSSNYDTVIALDWPHYCSQATEGCGGLHGWCYTFQGNQAGKLHHKHVAMVDVLARDWPNLFGETVAREVDKFVAKGLLPYPNLRYSGSGEVVDAYLPALKEVVARGVKLWGFTKSLALASKLRELDIGVIISCDKSSPPNFIRGAQEKGLPLAYTSMDVADLPPAGALVTFPIHRVGRVREVVNSKTVCPKVLADFLDDSRPKGSCQTVCRRCHIPNE